MYILYYLGNNTQNNCQNRCFVGLQARMRNVLEEVKLFIHMIHMPAKIPTIITYYEGGDIHDEVIDYSSCFQDRRT